jgi:hypothetical protein
VTRLPALVSFRTPQHSTVVAWTCPSLSLRPDRSASIFTGQRFELGGSLAFLG